MGRTARQKPQRLGEKLLRIRTVLGLSQNELIKRLGVEGLVQGTVSAYESGTREPSLFVLLEYAKAAGVYADALIDDELDLPPTLPCSPKSEGVRRAMTHRSQRRRVG